MFKKIALSALILLIVALVAAYFVRNILVKKAIETGSTYALGVETDLSSASLALRGGSLELNNLVVANPEGFAAKDFLSLRRGMIVVEAGSILGNHVVIDSFVIEGGTLNLEQVDRKGNFLVLLDNIKRLDMSSSGPSKKYRIGLIAVRDVSVAGSLSLLGKNYEKSFTLDDFSLRNVGGDDGATISQVAATLMKTLISKALTGGNGLLPEGFGKNLSDLKDQGLEKIKTGATDELKNLGKSLTGGKE